MKRKLLAMALLLAAAATAGAQAPAPASPWPLIEDIIGQKGSLQPGNVFKIGLPRADLTVKRGEVTIHPVLGLGSWIAFRIVDADMAVHGDLCLLEKEVNPVLTRLQEGGIETTALHNHLSGEQPRVVFLHFWGLGEPTGLAKALRAALDLTGTPRGASPAPAGGSLDKAALEKILGTSGKLTAGILQFSLPRSFAISMHGVELPPAMGMATALNFQPTAKGAVAAGDFVLREEELAAVLRALRTAGIEVTAVHNHMVDETPRMVFVHFWGEGPAAELARSFRAALDALEPAKR